MNVDVKLLEDQVATLGRVMETAELSRRDKEHLQGLWEMGHGVLDEATRIGQSRVLGLVAS